ncbi:MAG: M28 family peptidase [Verrucomicrobiales bacterium]|nr:M28 family peptidase [Verrucomicrobiales bacterium]
MKFGLIPVFFFLGGSLISCSDAPKPFDPASALEKSVSGQNAYDHVKALVGFGPRPAGSKALERSRLYLIEQLAQVGWTTQRQTFTAQTTQGEIEFTNLRARFGEGRWNEKVSGLLCSHFDTKLYTRFEFVGANDGGSSTGLLVELARVLQTRPDLAEELELVFFDGEEAFGPNITPRDGLYGSKHYAKELLMVQDLIPDWGILLDMVGDKDLKIRAGVQIPGSSIKDLAKAREEDGYTVDMRAVQATVQEMSRHLLSAAEDLDVRKEVGISPDYIIDDHIPLNVVAGIPAIDLIDFDFPYWHTPGDTLDKISAESLAISGRVTLQLVEKYLFQ